MDTSKLRGKDFEFLIIPVDIEVKPEDFDNVMTPNSIKWEKIIKNGWVYYQVGKDEFSYSWEMPGIQMTFNEEIFYDKAKTIADEIISKLTKYTEREINLIVISKDQIVSFD